MNEAENARQQSCRQWQTWLRCQIVSESRLDLLFDCTRIRCLRPCTPVYMIPPPATCTGVRTLMLIQSAELVGSRPMLLHL